MQFSDFASGSLVNLCILLALATPYGIIRGRAMSRRLSVPAWQDGILFGATATVIMLFPVMAHSGMIFDCRSGVIGAAALIGGPMVALASLPLPMAFRIYLGGGGVVPGLMELILPAVVGSACHAWFRSRREDLSARRVMAASVVVALVSNSPILVFVLFFMPEGRIEPMWLFASLIIFNSGASMAVLGNLILLERKHFAVIEALAASERRALHSQKMAAVGQLAHRITHSFTNALASILGHAEVAKSEAEKPEKVRRQMTEVIESVQKVSSLTAHVLAFARPAPLKICRLDLGTCLGGMSEIISRTIGTEVQVTVDADPRACKVDIDPDRIEQAMIHMAINAADAMPRGGQLSIRTGPAALSAREKEHLQVSTPVSRRHTGEFALLSVTDTGCGMSEEVRVRAFEPFFTTKDSEKNAGLGLSTVYSIVGQHNGYIEVKSTEGRGTTFLIYLPIPVEGKSRAEAQSPQRRET